MDEALRAHHAGRGDDGALDASNEPRIARARQLEVAPNCAERHMPRLSLASFSSQATAVAGRVLRTFARPDASLAANPRRLGYHT